MLSRHKIIANMINTKRGLFMCIFNLIKNKFSKYAFDDERLFSYVNSAILYAEKYQNKDVGFYLNHPIPPKTEQAIILLVSYLLGIFHDDSIWSNVNILLRFNMK